MAQREDRDKRAQARRQGYPGSVVRSGQDKPALYAQLTLLERLAHQTALVARQAALSGQQIVELPRSQWPGEVFKIDSADHTR